MAKIKLAGLAIMLCSQLSLAAEFRLNFQPKVGAVIRHKLTFSYRYSATGAGPLETGTKTIVMRSEQKFIRVSPDLIEANITLRTLSQKATGWIARKPLKDAPGYTSRTGYGPDNPLGFMSFFREGFPAEEEKGYFARATMPYLYDRGQKVGDYWDAGRPLFEETLVGQPNWDSVQSAMHYLSRSNTRANFEARITIPHERTSELMSSIGEISVLSEIAINLRSSAVERVHSQGSFFLNYRMKSAADARYNSDVRVSFSLLVQKI